MPPKKARPIEKQSSSGVDETISNASPQDTPSRDALGPPKPGPVHIPFLDRLRAFPEQRPIPWRFGQELPPERAIESPRVQQRGAVLLSTRGRVAEEACEHCAAGYGRFSLCITLDNWFQGACCSCIYTSKGNKCSLRAQTSGTADGRALRYHTDNPEVLQTYIRNAAENPKPPKKRKRRSTITSSIISGPPIVAPPYSSPYAQLSSAAPVSPDEDALLQAQIASEQAGGSSEEASHANKKQKWQHGPPKPNTARAQGPLIPSDSYYDAPDSPEQPEVLMPTPAFKPQEVHIWPGPQKGNMPNSPPINTIIRRVIPPTDAQPPPPPPPPLTMAKVPAVNIIDHIPKAKQRQMYAVISGLQTGIDNLQSQLNSLKMVLGIDGEDLTGAR